MLMQVKILLFSTLLLFCSCSKENPSRSPSPTDTSPGNSNETSPPTSGSLDSTFGTSGIVVIPQEFTSTGSAFAFQGDNTIFIAGSKYLDIGTAIRQETFSLEKHSTAGEFDTTFGNNGIAYVSFGSDASYANSVNVLPDGKILASGIWNNGSSTYGVIVRFNPDGSLDSSFDSDGKVLVPAFISTDYPVVDVATLDSGNILTAGKINGFVNVQKFSADGTNLNLNLESAYCGNSTYIEVVKIVPLLDGSFIIGMNSKISNTTQMCIQKFMSNGTIDTTFGTQGYARYNISPLGSGMLKLSLFEGKLYASGVCTNNQGIDSCIVRYNLNGSLDSTFGISGVSVLDVPESANSDQFNDFTFDSYGNLFAVGYSNYSATESNITAVKLTQSGSKDDTFGLNGIYRLARGKQYDSGKAIKVLTNGKIHVVGNGEVSSQLLMFQLNP